MTAAAESGEEAPYQDSIDAYRAYVGGDCDTVLEETAPENLEGWPSSEILWSTILLRAFCLELRGETALARATYELIRTDGMETSAALDASERLLFLDRVERDPGYAEWASQAKGRADPDQKGREPVERENATYPPVARALGVEGWAVVEFGVDPGGETVQPVVADSRPPLLFDGAALRAVRAWKFKRDRRADRGDRQVIRFLFKRNETKPQD